MFIRFISLQKDDNVPAAPTIDINQLSTLVQSLSLEADDISKDMVANAVMKYADSESHVEEILRILYIRILLDWKYARHMAYICAELVKIPNLGMKFRASLVRRIQSDFNSKCLFSTGVWSQGGMAREGVQYTLPPLILTSSCGYRSERYASYWNAFLF